MKKNILSASVLLLIGCSGLYAAETQAQKPACNTPSCDHKHEDDHKHEAGKEHAGCTEHQHAEGKKIDLPHDSKQLFALLEQQKKQLGTVDAATVADEKLHEQLETLQAVVAELVHVLEHDAAANTRVLGQLRNSQKAIAKVMANHHDRAKLATTLKQLQAQLGLIKPQA